MAPNGRQSRTPADKDPYHLVLLAKDKTGYKNLLKLATKAHLEGFYYKPRIDRELLTEHHEGLVALSACLGGEIPRLILEGRRQDAEHVRHVAQGDSSGRTTTWRSRSTLCRSWSGSTRGSLR